ncbi:hypothetical protein U1Q18_026006, partial [Sarracenia purpurea var. burkii]
RKQIEKMGKGDKEEELLKTLGDFTSKENWDNFFTIRGGDDSFEWPQLRHVVAECAVPPRYGVARYGHDQYAVCG